MRLPSVLNPEAQQHDPASAIVHDDDCTASGQMFLADEKPTQEQGFPFRVTCHEMKIPCLRGGTLRRSVGPAVDELRGNLAAEPEAEGVPVIDLQS